jgi:O-antigen ligase
LTNKAAALRHACGPCLSVAFAVWAAAIALAPTPAAKVMFAAPAVALPGAWWMFARPARWLAVFFAAALLLPPIPAPIGNAGLHPSLAIAAAGLFAGLLWLPHWRIPANALTCSLVTFFGLLLASVAQAALHSGPEAAAGSLARVGLFGISVYVFFYMVSTPAGEGDTFPAVRRLYWMAAASALFACVDFYFQLPAPAGYGPQFVWLDSGVYRRAQGFFYEANALGNFCAFFLVMIAVSLARPRGQTPVSRKGLLAGGVIFCAALMLSYSRGSVVNLVVALAVLLWLDRRRVRWARIMPVLAALGGAATFVTWKIFPAFAEIYWLRLSATTEFLLSATDGVLSGRVASWHMLLEWLAANPWQAALGIGYKTLPYSEYLGMPVVADNMYLSLLVETGVLGLAALLWLNVTILRAAHRAQKPRRNAPRNSFLGAWILCFWAGQMAQMLSGDLLTYWRVLPVYFWVLALAVRA